MSSPPPPKVARTAAVSRTEFAVRMTCGSCVAAVDQALRGRPGVVDFAIALDKQLVTVDATVATTDLLAMLTATGLQVVVRGKGGVEPVDPSHPHLGAAVAIMHPNGDTRAACGLVRLTQVSAERVVIDGMVDGLSPGLHGLHIHELGDLSAGCVSTGGHYNPTGTMHGGPADAVRHVGDLGNILADENGRAVFLLEDALVKVWDVIGRALVIDAEPDDFGRPNGAAADPPLAVGGVACGLLARSAGLKQNEKQVCACDGISLWGEKI